MTGFIARGTLALANATKKLRTLQARLTAAEVKSDIEHFEPYGYTSRAHPGAEMIVGFVGGDRSHAVALVVTDRRYRPRNLKSGEVCIFTDEGDQVYFRRGRVIEVVAGAKVHVTAPEVVVTASASVTLDTPIVHATGDIKADGQITDATSSMQSMRDTYNAHRHPGDSGGTTGTPNEGMS